MSGFDLYKNLPLSLSKEEQDKLLLDRNKINKEILILHNLRLVKIVVDKFQAIRYERDDCFQIGIIGLIKAVDTFDVNKNYEFSTYAFMCIKNEIYHFFVTMNRKKRTAQLCNIEEFIDIEDGKIRIEETFIEREMLLYILKIIDTLEEKNKNLVSMYFGLTGKTYTYKELSSIFNISVTNVRYRIFKSLDAIKDVLIEDKVMVKRP